MAASRVSPASVVTEPAVPDAAARRREMALASARRRERERSARRESILRAAERVFVERGYLRATMDDVALAAEVSKPTLYAYFRAKDELLLTLVLPVFEAIGDQLEALQTRLLEGRHRSGRAFVRDLAGALQRVPAADPERFRLVQLIHQTRHVAALDLAFRDALDAQGRRDFGLARSVLGEAMRRGLIVRRPVAPLADVIWGLVVGVLQVQDIKAETQGRDRERQRSTTLRLAERLLVEALVHSP